MDNPICASCHKGLSLEEIERGSFKHSGGRLFCSECYARMESAGRHTCPQCGANELAIPTPQGLTCSKCGAALPADGPKETAPAALTTRPRSRKPTKRCPYCGAILAAEALKCRYCSSPLTREARDLEASSRQNSQLRFWVGCLLSATVFLLLFLVYVLARSPRATEPKGAAAPPAAATATAAAPAPDPSALQAAELRREIERMRAQVEALKAEREKAGKRAALPPIVIPRFPPRKRTVEEPPAPKPPVTPEPKATPRPTTKVASAPPKPAPKTPEPAPKTPEPAPKTVSPAEVAAAAYPGFEAKLTSLKTSRRYGEALTTCRQFLAAHLGTPSAQKVTAAQEALRKELETLREDHAKRFRQAMAKGDAKAARQVVGELARYDAPELREDREDMLAALKAAADKPAQDNAKYLTQWQAPPEVARHLEDLKTQKDWTARSRAARQLAQIGHRAALGGLIEALKDPEWYVTISVIKALADIGDPVALPHVAPLTRASFPGIYDHAARACRALAAAPRDKYAEAWKLVDTRKVAAQLATALQMRGKEESAVTSRYHVALVETLALLNARQAAPALRTLAGSSDPSVSKAATDALEKLAGEPSPPGAGPGPAPKPEVEPTPKTVAKPEPPRPKPGPPAPKPEPAPKTPEPAPEPKAVAKPTPPAPKPEPVPEPAAKPATPKPPPERTTPDPAVAPKAAAKPAPPVAKPSPGAPALELAPKPQASPARPEPAPATPEPAPAPRATPALEPEAAAQAPTPVGPASRVEAHPTDAPRTTLTASQRASLAPKPPSASRVRSEPKLPVLAAPAAEPEPAPTELAMAAVPAPAPPTPEPKAAPRVVAKPTPPKAAPAPTLPSAPAPPAVKPAPAPAVAPRVVAKPTPPVAVPRGLATPAPPVMKQAPEPTPAPEAVVPAPRVVSTPKPPKTAPTPRAGGHAAPSAPVALGPGMQPVGAGGPARVPPPGSTGSTDTERRTVFAGRIEPAREPGTVAFGVRDADSLKKGQRLEVLIGGKPAYLVQVVASDPFRVVAKVLKRHINAAPLPGTGVVLRAAK